MIWGIFLVVFGVIMLCLWFGVNAWVGCHWFGVCPRCNSDAPDIDTCRVCECYRWSDPDITTDDGYRGKPPMELRRIWWERDKTLP